MPDLDAALAELLRAGAVDSLRVEVVLKPRTPPETRAPTVVLVVGPEEPDED